jgi:hypothetical protein
MQAEKKPILSVCNGYPDYAPLSIPETDEAG